MPPVTISFITNLSCADTNNLLLVKSSANTVVVAPELAPVIVSPLVNLPKDESSKIISEKMLATFSESMSNIEQIQQKIGDQMEATILQIDDALRQEMEKSLQSLGNQLASVSQKFVEDYTKLTNQMRIVVSQSDKFVN